jgi:4-amino-4-deoxy-L-arabinose transferase-like glycosyltransferase
MPKAGWEWARGWVPEIALGVIAAAMFLGFLGSVELWGKREQRAVAEAIDTIDHHHWLVAQIQGRPRLEKPPLPRWTIASLMLLTGRRDEWVARLPSAFAAIGMVWLVYALGRRLGGRSVGLTSGLILSSSVFFVSEMRQAGNDGPLAFFTTLALYAAWRRLHGGADQAEGISRPPAELLGGRNWATLMFVALGLGFLTKGPIILMLVGLTLVPYLVLARRFRSGSLALFEARGLVFFLLLALSWPVPVVLNDPNAVRVWYLEMAQKAGAAGVLPHRSRAILAADWPGLIAPWTLVAIAALSLPFWKWGKAHRPMVWFPWWWTFGSLTMFCFWAVAKPNYYLPCMPGAAILTGLAWVRLTESARETGTRATRARRLLQAHWVALFCAAVLAPVGIKLRAPAFFPWSIGLSVVAAVAVLLSARAWRSGGRSRALFPVAGAIVAIAVTVYGFVIPPLNSRHSHHALAGELERLVPEYVRTVMFFHELDEGLWFYLHGHDLAPVPGSQPRYNGFVDMEDDYLKGQFLADPMDRVRREKDILLNWLRKPHSETEYVLIKAKDYDLFGPEVAALVVPLYREQGLRRNELILVRAPSPPIPQAGLANGAREAPPRR